MATEESVKQSTNGPTVAPDRSSTQPVVFSSLTDEERQWGQYCHFAGVAGVLGTLICWLMKKDTSKYLDAQGKCAVNFHLTNVIISAICTITFVGIFLLPLLFAYNIVMSILSGVKAKDGTIPKYPFSFNLIK